MPQGAFYDQDLVAVEGREMGGGASLRLRVRNQVHIYTFLKAELENSLSFSEILTHTRGTRGPHYEETPHPCTGHHVAHRLLWWGGERRRSRRARSPFQPGQQGPTSIQVPCSYDAPFSCAQLAPPGGCSLKDSHSSPWPWVWRF